MTISATFQFDTLSLLPWHGCIYEEYICMYVSLVQTPTIHTLLLLKPIEM